MEICTISEEPETKRFKNMDESTENSTISSKADFKTVNFLSENTYISSMLDDIDFKNSFPSVTERYFTPYYRIDLTKQGDDICVWIHSNKICMISLASSHNVFKQQRIISVNFKVSDKLDRTTNKVSGKGKHGAQPLQENSNLCTITTSNEETHSIKCGMIGKLIEVNETLMEDPELLRAPPHKGGYLAIILLNIKLMDRMKETLLNKTEYEMVLKKRIHLDKDLEQK